MAFCGPAGYLRTVARSRFKDFTAELKADYRFTET